MKYKDIVKIKPEYINDDLKNANIICRILKIIDTENALVEIYDWDFGFKPAQKFKIHMLELANE
jgi:hypothetical protein